MPFQMGKQHTKEIQIYKTNAKLQEISYHNKELTYFNFWGPVIKGSKRIRNHQSAQLSQMGIINLHYQDINHQTKASKEEIFRKLKEN